MFSNEQITLDKLPSIAELSLEQLPVGHKYTQIISRVLVAVALLTVLVVIRVQINNEPFDIFIKLSPVVLFWILWPLVAHRFRGYALREHDLVYVSGVIWRKTTAIAFNRVQHIENKQGPLERLFDLSSLELFTAGGSGGDLSVPGLMHHDSIAMRQYILEKIRRQKSSAIDE